MSTFDCNYDQFKRIASDFFKAIQDPNLTLAQLDAGHKCVNLHYLGLDQDSMLPHEQAGLIALMRLVGKHYMEKELELGVEY